jgi:hypothetical protein
LLGIWVFHNNTSPNMQVVLDSPRRTGHARFPCIRLSRDWRSSPGITPWSVIQSAFAITAPYDSGRSGYSRSGMSISWCPSPGGRLSRPLTTMAPPTLPRFHRPICWTLFPGSLPRSWQWTLRRSLGSGYPVQPNRSSRLPIRNGVIQVVRSNLSGR